MTQYFPVSEISKRFNISLSKAYGLISQGKIGFLKIGGAYRISEKDIENFEKKNHFQPKRQRPF